VKVIQISSSTIVGKDSKVEATIAYTSEIEFEQIKLRTIHHS